MDQFGLVSIGVVCGESHAGSVYSERTSSICTFQVRLTEHLSGGSHCVSDGVEVG